MPRGTLQVAHGVIRFHSDDVFCPQKTPKNTKAIALVFWQKVKREKFFNWHLETNLPVQWNTKLWFILEGYSLGVLAESEVTKIFQLAL